MRWIPTATAAVAVILLALASLFLKPDYMAHVPVTIGVSALDSIDAGPVLEALADLVREKGGGDISWVYMGEDDRPEGCDFYLMPAVQYIYSGSGPGLRAQLVVESPGPSGLATGVVVSKPGASTDRIEGGRLIFPSRYSAAGYFSALSAMSGQDTAGAIETGRVDFTGCRRCPEKIAFGVIFGRYAAGGMTLYEYRRMLARGFFSESELEVRYTGPPVPEMVLASRPGMERWKESGFSKRLPAITGEAGPYLRRCLDRLGIRGFTVPGQKTFDTIESLADSIGTGPADHRP